MKFRGSTAAIVAAGVCAVLLPVCVSLHVSVPAAHPDRHPRPKTEPAEDLGVAYFRHRDRWHQMRVEMAAGAPSPTSGSGHMVRFSADASLWRYNRKSGEYDIPADFVRKDSFEDVYFAHEGNGAGHIAVRSISASAGGASARGRLARASTKLWATFDGTSAPPASEQTISGTATASFFPNSSSDPFHYEAKLERHWIVRAKSATEIEIAPESD